jgi:Xaa-Pro aminopeptidase
MSRIEKLNKFYKSGSVDAFLITSPVAIKYFSGYFFNFETGPSPFHLLPAALLIIPGGEASLIIADNELDKVPTPHPGISICPYASYEYTKAPEFAKQFLTQLGKVIRQHKLQHARVGIEPNALPYAVAQSLGAQYPKMGFKDITRDVNKLRVVKDVDEIEAIRRAAALCDVGQAAVVKYAKTGITELELFAHVRRDIEAAAGARVPLMADLVSGERTFSGGGGPTDRVIREGDLVLSDLTPCLNGYWGDSCSTIAIGDPTRGQKKNFERVKQALEKGIEAVRPGVKALEIDGIMRGQTGDYPHHGGHGVGIMYHEEPRIVAYNDTVLVPNMVIALEPAVYEKGYGIRLEHLVLVTESGCEILTQFKHCFD